MKIFIDTANVEEIKEAASWGILSGVTTNPSLIAKEGREFKTVVREITDIVDGSISAEVLSEDAEGMISEGRELAKIHSNITIKIPMTQEGLKAVNILSKEGIRTNVTLVFSAVQALLAARAGASYVSPFVGRRKRGDTGDQRYRSYFRDSRHRYGDYRSQHSNPYARAGMCCCRGGYSDGAVQRFEKDVSSSADR